MTRQELTIKYWRYYRLLEEKILNTVNFVEIDYRNFNTFSNEYTFLIQSIGAELDNVFKVFCGFDPNQRKTIADYADYILSDFPDITTTRIKVQGLDIELGPFQGWNKDSPAQSLKWWIAYNNIKHNRNEHVVEANQENVLNIIAALYILELKMFTRATSDVAPYGLSGIDIPSEDSKLFLLPKWKFRCIDVTDEVLKEMEI